MGGRKSFSPGDILQAADVQDFLMDQTVMVFGGTAARGSGIASPTEGMISYRTDADALEVYTGTAWVPAAQAAGAATVTNRNLLYNGAMQVSQRGTSVTGDTAGGYLTADRWKVINTNLGTWTNTIEADAPTGSGFRRSFKLLCTTADATPASGDLFAFDQQLEGQDCQRIAKGTASAKKLVLSFWVKANVTGTYIVALRDIDNGRSVSQSYTISASATWEKKTITFPADTTGALDNDNALSLLVRWYLAAGSSFTSGTLNTTWASYVDANTAVGQTNLAAATNNYWQVTGVQLEVGDVATDFEFKSFGQELRECQRYFIRYGGDSTYQTIANGNSSSTTRCTFFVPYPVPMRDRASSMSVSNVAHFATHQPTLDLTATTALTYTADDSGSNGAYIAATIGTNANYGGMKAVMLSTNNTTSARLSFSAEL